MPQCIAVKFSNGPKLHNIQVETDLYPEVNQPCVVSTRRGLELATIRGGITEDAKTIGYLVRLATPEDLAQTEKLRERADELKWFLKAKVRERYSKTKIIALEFNLDESLLVVSYTSEEQLSLRYLIQELSHHTAARIEFVNIGPRDQTRLLGAIGVCGDGACSATWLQSFSAVGIRMARDQQLPLNPEKISGPCGRLMCCLQFEHEMYEELLATMPRKGSRACHEATGTCGRINKLFPLKGTVEMYTDEGGLSEFPASELRSADRKN
ncbi:MAG: hypothetical protein KC422_15635 [Trueperaceae bacterium]|nr:hypothetical protein [Trueperaceae bacterium]